MRAILIPGNKIFSGETIDECLKNAREAGEPPVLNFESGWLGEEGHFLRNNPNPEEAQISESIKLDDKADLDEREFYDRPEKKKKTNGLRIILGAPFVILGSSLLMLAELIWGERLTFRGKEAITIMTKKARCSNCGHVGEFKIMK